MHFKKLFIVGLTDKQSLESSYKSAAVELGFDVLHYDLSIQTEKHIKLGKFGRALHTFLPLDAWTKKLNRDIIITAKKYSPDIFFYFTSAPILYGTLATLKATLPEMKIVWIWPDTPMNLKEHCINSAKLVDITATYSSSTIKIFSQLGFNNVKWVPLAGDMLMHNKEINIKKSYECDVSFVGGWRPERERAMKIISNNFKDVKIEVHGPLWNEKVRDKCLSNNVKGKGFYGDKLAAYFNSSRININQIDDTNFPAANMRFFEICTAGGLQLTSSCPEMEDEFRNKQHLLYYKNETELLENIEWVLNHPGNSNEIRKAGQQLINNKHSYIHRLESIIQELKNQKSSK